MIVFVSLMLIFNCCTYQESSYGDFDQIIVVADSLFYQSVEPDLELAFDQVIYTPHSERSYYLEWSPFEKLKNQQVRRNVLLLGTLNGNDRTSQYINRALNDDIRTAVSAGKVFEIFQPEMYAKEQMVIIMIAPDLVSFRENFKSRSEEIIKRLNLSCFERLERTMFVRGEQIDQEDYLRGKYGWKLKIQYDYDIVLESENGNFVWLRRLKPDRNLFIYRFPADSMRMESSWLIAKRDSLTSIYFETDSVLKQDTYIQRTSFAGRPALKMVGVWQNRKYLIGGPFRTYSFYDTDQKYIYLIDLMVTAPGKRKKPYLDQLEVMAQSFRLVSKTN